MPNKIIIAKCIKFSIAINNANINTAKDLK